jgi:hypothetical protein
MGEVWLEAIGTVGTLALLAGVEYRRFKAKRSELGQHRQLHPCRLRVRPAVGAEESEPACLHRQPECWLTPVLLTVTTTSAR